jgi:hypothetical protein
VNREKGLFTTKDTNEHESGRANQSRGFEGLAAFDRQSVDACKEGTDSFILIFVVFVLWLARPLLCIRYGVVTGELSRIS